MNVDKLGRNLALYAVLGAGVLGLGCRQPADPNAPESFDIRQYKTTAKDYTGKEKDALIDISGRKHKNGAVTVDRYTIRIGVPPSEHDGTIIEGSNSNASKYANGVEVTGIGRIQDNCWSDNYGNQYTVVHFNHVGYPMLSMKQCGNPSEDGLKTRAEEIYILIAQSLPKALEKGSGSNRSN